VWDIVARVTNPRPNEIDTSPLLVAVFLRPIDPGIKTSIIPNSDPRASYSVLSTLIDPTVPMRDRRNPVSADGEGRPTQDGRRDRGGEYAKPIVAEAGPGPGIVNDPGPKDERIQLLKVLEPSRMNDILKNQSIFHRVGQVFIDAHGVVHTVDSVGVRSIGGGSVKLTFIKGLTPKLIDVNGDEDYDGDDYNPIVFLPQASHVKPIVFTVQP